jgi:predicted dehydrogenase
MTVRVKIYGCGSIGNHLSHAAREMGWSVCACDVDGVALDRMKNDIYPGRYGAWDDGIGLYLNDDAPREGFDVIFVGTPPQHHIALAMDALEEGPAAVVVEKPLCPPDLEGADELRECSERLEVPVFVGYDHVVGKAAALVERLLQQGTVGALQTLDVEFREHWEGIFKAHPWLEGPWDSYLGYWRLGGGASGEHSHALNLWQHFAHVAGLGRIREIGASLEYHQEGSADYDRLCAMTVRTESGLMGRVVQDVVTVPSRKRAHLQGTEGRLEWVGGYSGSSDAVVVHRPGTDPDVTVIEKTRPDDFIREMEALDAFLTHATIPEGITLERGLDTVLVLAAAHRSHKEGTRMVLDYDRGYNAAAVSPVSEA